ncbi:MAG TPA: globin domain-containing protein [Burkholderiales bacterium]|nr:globin domain-containing protein [Burkholderiales bacterium]
MTPEQIELVRGTWRGIVPVRDTFAELFYGKLFSLDPALRPLFKGDLVEQGRNLAAMVSILVRNLASPEAVQRAMRELGGRHHSYGVREQHYETVGVALLWALDMSHGEPLGPEARAAWQAAYALIAGAMQEGARQPL